ncbi:transposase [Solibacillus sp. MA9]|uniref:Transposase n=1 Tax=Solibacillus palustris TaxID=2908203 RepID=A0ABS9UB50_9BACL|nr:transposase [Solibacillus sp. MA9]MCH7321188.1 transposase [Solibacillus sp. MA9]
MKFLLVMASLVAPVLMLFLKQSSNKFNMFFNIAAVLSTIIFGNIAATSIYQVIVDDTVFMTTIHALFLKPIFLVTGAYLGTFIIYRLILLTLEER